MPGPKRLKQSLIIAFLGIILNPNHLRMVRGAGADIIVGGIMQKPLTVPHLRLRHAGNSLEGELDAPEAPGAELSKLQARRWDVVVRALGDGGGVRVHGRLRRGARTESEFSQPAHGSEKRRGFEIF